MNLWPVEHFFSSLFDWFAAWPVKKWEKLCSTDQRFICTKVTSHKIHTLSKCQIKWKILSNFVDFLENLNCIQICDKCLCLSHISTTEQFSCSQGSENVISQNSRVIWWLSRITFFLSLNLWCYPRRGVQKWVEINFERAFLLLYARIFTTIL